MKCQLKAIKGPVNVIMWDHLFIEWHIRCTLKIFHWSILRTEYFQLWISLNVTYLIYTFLLLGNHGEIIWIKHFSSNKNYVISQIIVWVLFWIMCVPF